MTEPHDTQRPPCGERGTLRVVVEGTRPGAEPVVEVWDSSLDLVASVRANQDIEVEPGLYLVAAAMPDGNRLRQTVEVGVGQREHAILNAPVAFERAVLGTASVLQQKRSPIFGLRRRLSRLAGPSLYSRVEQGWGAEMQAPPEASPRVRNQRKLQRGTQLLLAFDAPHVLSVVQLALGRSIPVNVVLPLHFDARTAAADVQVRFDRRGLIEATAIPTGSPEIELIADYMRTNQLDAAAHVFVDQAETLLQNKIENPVAAALGGYALLRVGAIDRLHDWPNNLANWFPWLPDGPVIAGELAAREGDDASAVHWFANALDRGYPMFSDGLSLLAARLRQYIFADRVPAKIGEREPDVRRLMRLLPFVDFRHLSVTFTGLDIDDPAGSQEPLSRRMARDWTTLGYA
jgi:hypothetical protein